MSKIKEHFNKLKVICKDCGCKKELLSSCENCTTIKKYYPNEWNRQD